MENGLNLSLLTNNYYLYSMSGLPMQIFYGLQTSLMGNLNNVNFREGNLLIQFSNLTPRPLGFSIEIKQGVTGISTIFRGSVEKVNAREGNPSPVSRFDF